MYRSRVPHLEGFRSRALGMHAFETTYSSQSGLGTYQVQYANSGLWKWTLRTDVENPN